MPLRLPDGSFLYLAQVREYQRVEHGREETVRAHQTRTPPRTGEWIPEVKWEQGQKEWEARGEAAWRSRYEVPPHERLLAAGRQKYRDPVDHPFFKGSPVSADNVVSSWDAATEDQKSQGMRWYADAHRVAKAIADGDADKGAAMLSVYSPQTAWPANLFNASRALEEHRALGPGDGMITESRQHQAAQILAGEDPGEVITNAKTRNFWQLISQGADDPADRHGRVVVDRHALSVAVGHRVSDHEYDKFPKDQLRMYEHVADQYREAARRISAREGVLVTPHQVQAVTWLQRQHANQEADAAAGSAGNSRKQRLAKGMATRTGNAWKRWSTYADAHHLPVEHGTTALTGGEPDVTEPAEESPRHPPAAWKGPGQWRTFAEEVQEGEPEEDDEESDSIDLASVRPYERRVRGRVEHVSGYHSRDERSLLNGWIPAPKWKQGQKEWAVRGEAIWKANEWKPHPAGELKPGDQAEFTHPVTGKSVRGTVRAVNKDSDGTVRVDVEHEQQVPRPYQLPPGSASKRVRPEITEDQARGNSRPVSKEEFQHLAALGNQQVDIMKRDASPPTGLTDHWADIKARAWKETREPWGGLTADSHTGELIGPEDKDAMAMSVKPGSMHSMSVPEDASQQELDAAMDQAIKKFEPVLARHGYALGVFRDSDVGRIDIDPVLVVHSPYEVETIGAYARSIGGAYVFATGDGYFPPHVDEAAEHKAMERTVIKVPAEHSVLALPSQAAGSPRAAAPRESADAVAEAERADRAGTSAQDLKFAVDKMHQQLFAGGSAAIPAYAGGSMPNSVADWQDTGQLAEDGGPGAEAMRRNQVIHDAGRLLDEELQRRVAASLGGPEGQKARDVQTADLNAKISRLQDERWDAYVEQQRAMRRFMDQRAQEKYGFISQEAIKDRLQDLSEKYNTLEDIKQHAGGVVSVEGMTEKQLSEEIQRLAEAEARNMVAARAATAQMKDKMRQMDGEIRSLHAARLRLEHADTTAQREEAIKMLQEIRGEQFGGKGLLYQGRNRYTEVPSHPKAADEAAMRWAESNYPQSWLDHARQHGGPMGYSLIGGVPRGDYTDSIRRIRISDGERQMVAGANKTGRVSTHELGHAMERSVPGLVQMEQAEVWRRTSSGELGSRTIEAPQALDGYTKEYGRPDKFPLPYSGKDYAPGGYKVADSYELFTTGAEALMAGSPYLDTQFRQWMLGVMALLGRADSPGPGNGVTSLHSSEALLAAAEVEQLAQKAVGSKFRGGTAAKFILTAAAAKLRNGSHQTDPAEAARLYEAAARDLEDAAAETSSNTWSAAYKKIAAQARQYVGSTEAQARKAEKGTAS